jgi:polar amino acid transport system permease protein
VTVDTLGVVGVIARGVPQTVAISVVSFLVGAVLAVPLGLARRSAQPVLRWPAGAVVEVVRAVPAVVWLFIVYYAIGSGAVQLSTFQAAVIGLGVISGAHLAEIYRAGLAAVPRGQGEAALALALPTWVRYRHVLGPQALTVVVPPASTYAIGLLKDSAVASVIGATDIAFRAVQQTQQDLDGLTNFAVAGAFYLLLSVPVAVVARVLHRRLARAGATA